jgi:hypothetical protein
MTIWFENPGEVGISAEQIDGLEGLGYVGSPGDGRLRGG